MSEGDSAICIYLKVGHEENKGFLPWTASLNRQIDPEMNLFIEIAFTLSDIRQANIGL